MCTGLAECVQNSPPVGLSKVCRLFCLTWRHMRVPQNSYLFPRKQVLNTAPSRSMRSPPPHQPCLPGLQQWHTQTTPIIIEDTATARPHYSQSLIPHHWVHQVWVDEDHMKDRSGRKANPSRVPSRALKGTLSRKPSNLTLLSGQPGQGAPTQPSGPVHPTKVSVTD